MHMMAGMYKSRDIVFLGRLILGTMGPRKFVWGHIVSGRPITPPSRSAGFGTPHHESDLFYTFLYCMSTKHYLVSRKGYTLGLGHYFRRGRKMVNFAIFAPNLEPTEKNTSSHQYLFSRHYFMNSIRHPTVVRSIYEVTFY